jgi:hypothetical protein
MATSTIWRNIVNRKGKTEDIHQIPEGRGMDALIATSVFGWRIEGRLTVPPPGDPRISWCAMWDAEGRPHWMPNYSTDLVSAFEVVKRIMYGTLRSQPKFSYSEKQGWCCDFEHGAKAFAPTLELAICRAALLVVNGNLGMVMGVLVVGGNGGAE